MRLKEKKVLNLKIWIFRQYFFNRKYPKSKITAGLFFSKNRKLWTTKFFYDPIWILVKIQKMYLRFKILMTISSKMVSCQDLNGILQKYFYLIKMMFCNYNVILFKWWSYLNNHILGIFWTILIIYVFAWKYFAKKLSFLSFNWKTFFKVDCVIDQH